jgi:2-amino-4-hydroxy-6-hydroxymethyldihydropteridine diphosphokinase
MAEAILALGGNIGDVRATLDRAVALFCDGAIVRLLARSSDYRTAPWGRPDQPDFVNLCLIVGTDLDPRALLARAQTIEAALGRDRARETRWGPRPIDIDLIAYDNIAMAEPNLTLPHPHWAERAFVLVPLVEIAPDRIIDKTTVRAALARRDCGGVERLPALPAADAGACGPGPACDPMSPPSPGTCS